MGDTKNLQMPLGIMMDKKDIELYRFLDFRQFSNQPLLPVCITAPRTDNHSCVLPSYHTKTRPRTSGPVRDHNDSHKKITHWMQQCPQSLPFLCSRRLLKRIMNSFTPLWRRTAEMLIPPSTFNTIPTFSNRHHYTFLSMLRPLNSTYTSFIPESENTRQTFCFLHRALSYIPHINQQNALNEIQLLPNLISAFC